MATTSEHYRADGVRITHDPHAKGMAEKYGEKGATDSDGFDPYADAVRAPTDVPVRLSRVCVLLDADMLVPYDRSH